MDLALDTKRARDVSDNVWLERSARVGLVAYGVMHLLIAWLALELAFGNSAAAASQQGALHAIAGEPLGDALLWIIALGMFALALWQVTQTIWGHTRSQGPGRLFKRLGSAGRVIVYAGIGYSAVKVAIGAGSHDQSQQLTSRLMSVPAGRLLVALVGVAVFVIALVFAKRGVTTSFTDDLEPRATSGMSGTALVRTGQLGYLAKAVAFGVLGALFVWAAWTYDAKKAGGLDAALATLLAAGPGPWLLIIVALGIGCFGLYCFGWARYADTTT